MNKTDLRSGMRVTTRRGDTYYVVLNAGIPNKENDVIINNIGQGWKTGWMSLSDYTDDLIYCDLETKENDPEWDIVKVEKVDHVAYMFGSMHYRKIWERP